METIKRSMQYSNGPGRIQKILAERHCKRYDELQLTYLISATEYSRLRTPFEPVITTFPEFSSFGDPMKYAGKIPSAPYISFMYTQYMKRFIPIMDQHITRLSGTILKGDHSHKFNKKMYRVNNCPSFTGLYTVTNEYDEIRVMVLTPTKALDFLKGPFEKRCAENTFFFRIGNFPVSYKG